ncbi:MAG: 3-oxoacyl-ACP reductase FabG, partial [Acidobacteria bacterium]|nr:3-oxoacyl-ACP reductase FabG [Acidobacteriota bacterium]
MMTDKRYPDLDLEGRVAIVTGASRGIGRAVVERFALSGTHVVVNYLKDERAANEIVSSVERLGVKALPFKADVSRPEEAEMLVVKAKEQFGRVDFLVSNAGIWEGASIEDMDETLWDRVIDINLKGTWAICKASIPEMRRGGFGRIVMVSSTSGQRGEAGFSNYSASKGGQISLMKSLAVELAPVQINVNAVAPGWVETEMCAEVFSNPEQRQLIEKNIPLGRIATTADIASPILFLCSGWARHITGEVLNINGG